MALLCPLIVVFLALARCLVVASTNDLLRRGTSATLPIYKRHHAALSKRQKSSAIGLGDDSDVSYSVQVEIGGSRVPVIFDTGSSDLWSISTDCSTLSCGSIGTTPQVAPSSLRASGLSVELNYGDSTHATSALGMIFSGSASIAGLEVPDQFVAAINNTDTGLSDEGISGIFGAGFPSPSSSAISTELLKQTLESSTQSRVTNTDISDAFIASLPAQGPLLARLVMRGQLEQPMYTVTLQREALDVGGNVGQLTIGQLPEGVTNDSLTWVPVRLYTTNQGGTSGPSSSPNEIYPLRWEIPIDDVQINGQTLPRPQLPDEIGYTALIDSGTSFLAGPASVVSAIFNTISTGSFDPDTTPMLSCNTPVHLSFTIGGKSFPVDPRDFLGQQQFTDECTANFLTATDSPSSASLMSWVLGDPFMKSNLIVFYFGNLTHPSADPPRMGFLSTVPSNADTLLSEAVSAAEDTGDFVVTKVDAPSGTFTAVSTNSAGVGQGPTSVPSNSGGLGSGGDNGTEGGSGQRNDANRRQISWIAVLVSILAMWVC